MKVDKNNFVEAQYKLYIDNKNGKGEILVEETTDDLPFQFIHGLGMMLPSFEQNLLGLEPGDEFDFEINPGDAYGQRNEDYIADLPKKIFFVDGKFDSEMVKPGNTVPLLDSDGNQLIGTILEINEDTVKVDLNHPLAGEKLHFTGKIVEVHPATSEEINMFFPQHNCGGGCSGCSGCC